ELGTVTGAEEAAEPGVAAQVGRADFRPVQRRAAEVRTNADDYQVLRLDRTIFVLGVRGLLGHAGVRIGQLRFELLQVGQHLLRTPDDPNGTGSPCCRDALARLELADVDRDRRAG